MLFSYLRRRLGYILMLLLFALIFAVIFSLYELQAEAVLYASALCLAVGAVFFFFSYRRYALRRRELLAMEKDVTSAIASLPAEAEGFGEEYRALLLSLRDENARILTQTETEKRDMLDYYTLWAHQIKTPIAAMRLLLQTGSDPGGAALSIELTKIEQYVEMVLGYLRLGSETGDFVLGEYALDGIIRGAVRKFAALFISKKLSLDFRETGLTVMTDEKWLLFVIEQLLSNALKYTREGGITIYSEGYGLYIEDTGIGIRPEDLPMLFGKGFTGFNGRLDKKSTGLGLYLCKGVCSKLGHGISIDSAPGRGTRVKLDLTPAERVTE